MSLPASELAAVCDEVARALTGRSLQKVVQPDRSTVILGFSKGWLLLSCDAQLGRMHLCAKPAGTGDAPPAFCMLLRKELIGARLAAVTAVAGERACELTFEGPRLRLFLFGKAAQLQLCDPDGKPVAHIGPAKSVHEGLPAPRAAGAPADAEGISARIEARFAGEALERTRKTALGQLNKDRQRVERRIEALQGDRARAGSALDKRKLGDLLLAHLHEVPRGAKEVTLPDDFEGGAPITIKLDPARGAKENAERFYKEHKRLSRAIANIDERLAASQKELSRIDAELQRIGVADTLPAALVPATGAAPRKRREGPAPPYKAYRASTGAEILVGRGAEKNDELTFQIARGSDLWLHARDVPGAHVVVRLPSNGRIDEQTLLDAATLAAHHSNARGEAQIDVGYTLRKHVRKPPKSKAGVVTFSSMKTIRVRMEAERLQRLLASLEE